LVVVVGVNRDLEVKSAVEKRLGRGIRKWILRAKENIDEAAVDRRPMYFTGQRALPPLGSS
jgi:hypothetical protein